MITLLVNGERREVGAGPDMPVLWALRDLLDLKGTKYGCGLGSCGSCTVLLDGQPVRSCTVPISSAEGKAITTIEGLSENGDHPLQKAWLRNAVPQCGYCQPGQLMSAVALLRSNPDPTDAEIDAAMDGVLCRCGTYRRIKSAIQEVVMEMSGGPS